MRIIHATHPHDFPSLDTAAIQERFLLPGLVKENSVEYVYTHYDRMVIGAAMPTDTTLALPNPDALKAPYFLARREMGIINIGGTGNIVIDGESYTLEKCDCLYIGKGKESVLFEPSIVKDQTAKYIFFSCPAHQAYPVQLMKSVDATPAEMGTTASANHRTINKYIHADGLQSCQLMLGVTNFKPGSIWNTMPPHLHDRRMEAYFYFDLPEAQRAIHFMGEPHETRHLFLQNEEGIVSPSWSIHSGVATSAYSFIWAMAGENISFTDMDPVKIESLA